MHDVVILGIKAMAGGGLVMLFALVSEVVQPKRFSGLFGVAPAIALASLIIMSVSDGAGRAHDAALGMIAGSAGLTMTARSTTRTSGPRQASAAPSVQLRKLRGLRTRELTVRFVFGSLASVLAGLVSITVGRSRAREDAHGAIIGAVALAVFAVVSATMLTRTNSLLALGLALLGWSGIAATGYALTQIHRSIVGQNSHNEPRTGSSAMGKCRW